jgi:hypothetical protein
MYGPPRDCKGEVRKKKVSLPQMHPASSGDDLLAMMSSACACPGKSRGESLARSELKVPAFSMELLSPLLVMRCCYFCTSEDQFKMTDKGAEVDVSAFVLTRNLCPSEVTS